MPADGFLRSSAVSTDNGSGSAASSWLGSLKNIWKGRSRGRALTSSVGVANLTKSALCESPNGKQQERKLCR